MEAKQRKARDPYRHAGAAGRQAMAAARQAGLGSNGWQVLSVVVELTVLWSRLEDAVTIREITAARYGVEPARVARHQTNRVRETLKELAGLGLVIYVPPGRPGGEATVGLPSAHPVDGGRVHPATGVSAHPADGCADGLFSSSSAEDVRERSEDLLFDGDDDPTLPPVGGESGERRDRCRRVDDLARRLASVCVTDRDVTGPARRAVLDAVDRSGADLDLVDEMVSWLETAADTPTRSPRRLTAMISAWVPATPPAGAGSSPAGRPDDGFGLFDLAAGAAGSPFDDLAEPVGEWAPPPDGLFDEMRAMLAGQKADTLCGDRRAGDLSRW